MKKLNIYNVYIDDGESVYKVVTPAEDKQEAITRWRGNGEIISVIETECPINLEYVSQALTLAGFGQTEVDIITRTLSRSLVLTGVVK